MYADTARIAPAIPSSSAAARSGPNAPPRTFITRIAALQMMHEITPAKVPCSGVMGSEGMVVLTALAIVAALGGGAKGERSATT